MQSEFCSGCGSPLEPPPLPAKPEAETGAESWRWVTIWTVLAIVIVALLCIFAFRPEGKFEHHRQVDTPQTVPGGKLP
ncbi:MAG: hypothetical protein M3Y56_15230 [Armatimonadota bacterium]|nr:hypothetical protein [Armatimonadota bacterium]